MRPSGVCLLACVILPGATAARAQIHSSPMAGRWFPAGRPALERAVDASFANAARRGPATAPRKNLAALVVPHAGLEYSGAVAAAAYRLLDRPARIVLLAFSHRRDAGGVAAPDVEAYATPLGQTKVDREALRELGFPIQPETELCDHSLENQLPFLQRIAPEAPLVPLLVGTLRGPALDRAARKLAAWLRAGDVLIASSDFTHYGEAYGYLPFPRDGKLAERLRRRAADSFEEIGSLNVAAFDRFLSTTGDTICGAQPIRLLMAALALHREQVYMSVASYASSGESTRDWSLSVGYGALAFYPASAFAVDRELQRLLLDRSRAALDHFLNGGDDAPRNGNGPGSKPDLAQRTGVFVTVRKSGKLRGCVGTLSPGNPVLETVAERTVAAAAADPRFRPLSNGDGQVTLEISLLTPIKRLHDWRNWRPGFGAIISMDNSGALLLPQVAGEMGGNRDRFLESLARKAGLPGDAYKQPQARLYVFEAQVFGE